jgi:bifunctional non-homologous end joining protein LigD
MRSKADGGRLRFIEFQQPTLVETPPDGDGWLHEIKYDGYRTELVIERGRCRAFTRRGFDWTEKYGPIVEAASPDRGRRHKQRMEDHRLAVADLPHRLDGSSS